MHLLLLDNARRYKAWKNGQFVYTPFMDETVIKITHHSEFLFAFRDGDKVLPIEKDGSIFKGNANDFLKRMGFEDTFNDDSTPNNL